MAEPKQPTKAQVKKLGTRLAEVKALLEQLTKEKTQITTALGLLPPGEYEAGEHTVNVGTTTTIDAAIATKKFPATKYPDLYKLVLDIPAFRASIAANEIGPFTKVSPRISVD